MTDAVGTRTFSFDADLNPDKEIINTSGNPQLYYREITREYEPEPPLGGGGGGGGGPAVGFVVGRPKKVQVGVSGDVARDYETEYFYDLANARFNRVSRPGLPSFVG